jgi:thioredoxin 1
MASASVRELTDADFKDALAPVPLAFVDVYASWCGPCRLFSPLFEKVAARNPQVAFFKVDGDLNPGAREGLTIDNLPYIAVFRNGRFDQGYSTASEEDFEAYVRKVAGSA